MQNTVETKKVGAGIITMSILYLLGQGVTILVCLIGLANIDEISESLKAMGLVDGINTFIISVLISKAVILAILVILILYKKPIGAYLFIAAEILLFIYQLISSGLNINKIIMLIFPALMIFFMYKKKDIYFVRK